ncbi:hypothetical protein AX16_009129 [Volvariella volvacea WC 439]|nr:hypothetical protein AX16_009129 [Volvariella volvacea WC 439]
MPPTDLQSRIGDKVHRNSNGTYRNRVWVRDQNERQQEPPISSRPPPYRKRDYSPPYRGVKSEPREPENLWDSPSEGKWQTSRRDPPALSSRLSSHSSAGEKFTKRKSSLIDRIGDRSSRPSSWDVQDTRSDISEMGSNDIVGRGTYSVSPCNTTDFCLEDQIGQLQKHLYDSPQQYNENFSANRATQFVEPKTAIPVHNSAHKSTSGPPIADSASTWLNNLNLPPSSASLERCKELLSSLVDLNLQRRKGTKGVNPAPKQSKGGDRVLTEDVCLSFLSHSKSIHSEMEHTPSGLQPSGYHVVDNHISINKQNGEPHSPFDMKYQNHFRGPHAIAPIASIAPRFHEKSNAEQGQNRRYFFDRASPLSRNSRDNSRGHADAALPTPPASASHSSPSREPPKAPRAMMSDTFHPSPPSGRVSRLSSSSKDPSDTGNRDSNGITGIAQMKPVTPSPSTTYKPLSVESGPIPIPWPASYTSPTTTSSGTAIPIPLDLTFLQQDKKRDKEPSRMDPRENSPVRPMVSPRRRNSSPRRRNTSPSPKLSSPTEFSRPSYPRRVSRSPSRLPLKPVLRRSTWDTSPNYHRRSVSPMRPRSPRPLTLSSRSANLLKRERSIERHEAPRRSNGSPPRRDAVGPGAYGARGRTPPPPKKRRNYSPSPPPSATSHRPLSPAQKERGPSNRYGTQERATRNYTYAGLKRGFLSGPSGWKSFSDLNGSRRERDAGSESQRRPHSRERNTQLLPKNTAPQAVNVHPAVRVKTEEEPIRLGMDVDVIDVKEIGEKGDESLDDDRELYGSPRYPDQPLDLDQGDRDQQDSVLECEKLPSPPALLPNQSQPKPPKVSPTPVSPAPPVTTDAGSTDAGRIHDGIRNVHAEDSITNEGNDNVHNPLSNTHKDSPIQGPAASMERGTASPRHTPGPFSALEAKTQLELDPPRNDGLRDASAHDNAPELAGDHRDRDVDLPQEEVQIGQRDALLWRPSLQIPPQHPNDHQQDDPEERSPAIENMRMDLDREQYQRQQNVVVQSHNASGQTMLAFDINSLITDLNSGPVQCNNVPGRWFTVSGSNHMNVVDVPFMVDNSIASEWSFAG